jgi:hypothetical protein
MDLSTPESILASAEKIQDPQIKMRLQMLAQQRKAEQQKMQADAQKMKLDEARAEKELALAEKALRENPNLATAEVGIKGKPGWTQVVLYDKTDSNQKPVPIGDPKQSSAAMRIEMGGAGGSKESIQPIPYIDPSTGKATWGTIADARGKTAAAYDPITKQVMSQATEVGKGRGEEIVTLPKQKGALDSVKGALSILDKGIYSGFWGPEQKAVVSATPLTDKAKAANTDEFVAYVGEIVVPRLSEFGGNDSNEELRYLRQISGGELTMQESALKNILKRAEAKIQRGVDRVSKGLDANGNPIANKASSGAYSDAEKEARYQAWKRSQGVR